VYSRGMTSSKHISLGITINKLGISMNGTSN